MSDEHRIKKQDGPRFVKGSVHVTLTCACGHRAVGSSRKNSQFVTDDDVKRRALENAEAGFRKHIPIR